MVTPVNNNNSPTRVNNRLIPDNTLLNSSNTSRPTSSHGLKQREDRRLNIIRTTSIDHNITRTTIIIRTTNIISNSSIRTGDTSPSHMACRPVVSWVLTPLSIR